jgi:hypothetical protein
MSWTAAYGLLHAETVDADRTTPPPANIDAQAGGA